MINMYILFLFTLFAFQYTTSLNENKPMKYEISEEGEYRPNSFMNELLGITEGPEEPEITINPVDVKNCEPCECGLAESNRILHGDNVTSPREYPWVAQLYYADHFRCGATLINSKYVITAAHCIYRTSKNLFTVRILENFLKGIGNNTGIVRKVSKIVMHKGFHDETRYNNDIALLRLDQDVPLNSGIFTPTPICLPTEGRALDGSNGTVIGWGTIRNNGPPSKILLKVTLPVLSNEECKNTNWKKEERAITDNMMCAGFSEGEKDACKGDSGGPLHIIDGNIQRLAGIVSFGRACGLKNYPGIYTRVSNYLDWINYHTRDACPCFND